MSTTSDFGLIPKSLQVCVLEAVGTSTSGTGGHIRASGNVGVRGTVDLGGLKVASNDFVFTSQLMNRTFHNAVVNSSASGSNSMFTVPTGKKARVLSYGVYNPTGLSATMYVEWDFGSGFVRWSSNVTATATTGSFTGAPSEIVLEPGHSFSVNTSVSGLSVFVSYCLFPSTEQTQTYRVATSTVKQTLFTCPVGKVAVNAADNVSGTVNLTANIRLINPTSNTPTITVSIETTTTAETSIHRSVASANSTTALTTIHFTAGDIIRVVSSTDDVVYAAVNLTLLSA